MERRRVRGASCWVVDGGGSKERAQMDQSLSRRQMGLFLLSAFLWTWKLCSFSKGKGRKKKISVRAFFSIKKSKKKINKKKKQKLQDRQLFRDGWMAIQMDGWMDGIGHPNVVPFSSASSTHIFIAHCRSSITLFRGRMEIWLLLQEKSRACPCVSTRTVAKKCLSAILI